MVAALRAVAATEGFDEAALETRFRLTEGHVREVNRAYGTAYGYPACLRRQEDAENVTLLFLLRKGMETLGRTGRLPTSEDLANAFRAASAGHGDSDDSSEGAGDSVGSGGSGGSGGPDGSGD